MNSTWSVMGLSVESSVAGRIGRMFQLCDDALNINKSRVKHDVASMTNLITDRT